MSTKVKATVKQKREQALDRQHAHDHLTIEQRLRKLDQAPGEAKKERARLMKPTTNAK